jgi:hypothetical protein
MAQHIDPILLPTVPVEITDQRTRDYLNQFQSAIQAFCDNVFVTINNGLVPYYVLAVNQNVTSGAVSFVETISPPLTTATVYSATVTPNWLTTYSVTSATTGSFSINFGTPAPALVGTTSAQVSVIVWLNHLQ